MKIVILLFLLFSLILEAKDYTKNKQTQKFIDEISKTHQLDKEYLQQLFSDVEYQKTPLRLYDGLNHKKKKEKIVRKKKWHGSWDRYARHKVTNKRAKDGVNFIQTHKSTFEKVEKEFGVPCEYIAAIIGIETVYGKHLGNFPVFDTLTTLAFEKNRRNDFFKEQLKEFILLTHKDNIDPKSIQGSYAGAIGLGQFMPSSYIDYGIDFNNDNKVDMLDAEDVIASIGNYLHKHGWETDQEVATRVSYEGKRFEKHKTGFKISYNRKDLKGIKPKFGKWDYHEEVRLIKLSKKRYDELWYGAHNFYVITRYNNSSYYAMSIHQLAEKIKKQLPSDSTTLASNQHISIVKNNNQDTID